MLHRLRVLNFSKSFSSDGTDRSKAKKLKQERNAVIPERNTSITINISNPIEEPVCSKETAKQSCVKFNDVEESDSESGASSTMFQRNLTGHKKSLSKPLTCQSKKDNLKNLSRRKTLSLFDVKKRRTRKRHQHYKHIKLAFQSFKKEITTKRSRKKFKRTPEPLQSTATRNVTLNNKLTCRRRRKQSDASTSYTDMFGFCSKKIVLDPKPLYQMGKNDDSIFRKLKRRSATKRKNILYEHSKKRSHPHQACRVVSSGLGDDSSFYSTRLHYNLVDISHCPCTLNEIGLKDKRPNLQEAKNDANLLCSRCFDAPPPEKKNASISCLAKASCTDAACVTSKRASPASSVSCSKKSYQSNTSKCVMCKKCLKKTVSFKKRRPMANGVPYTKTSAFRKFQVFSEKLHHKRDIQGKTVLKYVILAIVAVAWSPCVIAIACGWLLTYPLRPHQVMSGNNKGKCEEECSSYYNNNNSVWALMMGNMKNAFNKTVSTGSAIKSLFVSDRASKMKSHEIKTSPTLINSGTTFPKQSKHPNLQRRYTLSYNDERGWIMKPVRQKKRNRERTGVFSQALRRIVCGCVGTSNAMRQAPNIFAYNVTAEKKQNNESSDVSNKSIKSSSTQKLPVDAKSKHFELLNKCRLTNRCKTEPHEAYSKCCRDHHKTYTDKKTGGESISSKLESKIILGKETEMYSTEPTKRSSLSGRPKVSHQSRPKIQKAFQRGSSSTEAKALHQPNTQTTTTILSPICKKCCKRHSAQSSKSVDKRQTECIDTNVLVSKRCQRRRTPCSSGSIVLVPKRSMSTLSICRPDPCLSTCRIPKRSRSECRERAREPCRRCRSRFSRCCCKIGSKGDFEEPSKLSKKVSFKNDLIKSPAGEHISIKVKKKKKKQPKPEDDKDKKKKIKCIKPVVVLQKLIPANYRYTENGEYDEREVETRSTKGERRSRKGERLSRKRERRTRNRGSGCCYWFNRCDRCFRNTMWPVPMHLNCRDLYLYAMKRRPCFWVYRSYPKFYPKFLELYNYFMICCHSCMLCLSMILWSPCFLGCYACYLCCCDLWCSNY